MLPNYLTNVQREILMADTDDDDDDDSTHVGAKAGASAYIAFYDIVFTDIHIRIRGTLG